MKKPFLSFKKTDIDFLMRTLIYALLFLAIIHAFRPYLSDSEAQLTPQNVEELARQTKSMAPEDVASYLQTSARPTMLVVYASWCAYCKKMMPQIYSLWQDRKINGDQMLVVSRDSSVYSLSKYLLSSDLNKMLGTPIILKNGAASLTAALRPLGSGFDGGIPYIGFFDAGGKLEDEIMGYTSKSDVEASLRYLQ